MGARDVFRTYSMTSMQTNLLYSAPIRFFLAYEWLNSGLGKLFGSAPGAASLVYSPDKFIAGLTGAFKGWAATNPNPMVAGFLKGFVVPNAGAILWMTAICETLTGIAFLLGFFARPAAVGGMTLNTFFYLASGFTSPSTAGVNLIMIGAQASMLLVSPGRFAGLDYFMHKRFANLPLW